MSGSSTGSHVQAIYMLNMYTCLTYIHVGHIYMSDIYTCLTYIHVQNIYMTYIFHTPIFLAKPIQIGYPGSRDTDTPTNRQAAKR